MMNSKELYKINIKPLSVNKAWQGRRFKTRAYKDFQKELLLKLPEPDIEPEELRGKKFRIDIEFGFTNYRSDWDNPIKPFVDVLQRKYLFDDYQIYEANIKKRITGENKDDYIKFNMTEITI